MNNTNNQNSLLKQHYGNNNQSDLQKFYGKNSNTNVSLLSNTVPTNVNTSSVNNVAPTATAPSKTNALDTWYNNAIKLNEQNRNAELEENYVRQQLMEKYLPQDMKLNGLSGSGLAELYKQKTNTDYMNNRALINSNYNNSNQSLLENYTNQKLAQEEKEQTEKEQNILDWYTRMHDGLTTKIDALEDEETGKLSEENYNSLYKYIEDNKGNLNSHYEGLLKNYLDDYKMSEEQIAKYNEQKSKEESEKNKNNELGIEQMDEEEYLESIKENVPNKEFDKVLNKNAGIKGQDFDALWESIDNLTIFGSKNGKAGNLVKKISYAASKGQLINGDIIDFNYGLGTTSYLYYNGKFYRTNSKPNCEINDKTGKVTRNW